MTGAIRHARGTLIARTVASTLLIVAVCAPALASPRPRAGVVIGVGVLPQLEQSVGGTAFPAELYRVEALLPLDRAWSVVPSLAARRDFASIGLGAHREVWGSSRLKWRVGAGLAYTIPFGETEDLFRRHHGEGSSTLDRLALRASVGETFDLERGRVALRVEYDARWVRPGSVLSLLEHLDDPVDTSETFWLHEIFAGLEIRLGSP